MALDFLVCDDGSGQAVMAEGELLQIKIREELLRHARLRSPIIYARLAERVALPSTDLLATALEALMEEDAGAGRPLLAAIAIGSFATGVPAPWFFRKAREIGLLSSAADDVESFAFHAGEFYRAIRFYTRAEENEEGAATRSGRRAFPMEDAMLEAKDIMTTDVVSTGPRSSVGEVADLLLDRGLSALPVIDAGKLVGIVSEGDLVRRAEIGTAPRRRSWWLRLFAEKARLASEYVKSHSTHVTDVMTRDVLTVEENTPVSDIADLLVRKRIKRVPVMREGRVVGIVGRANLVRALAAVRHMTPAPVRRDDSDIRRDLLDALGHESWTYVGTTGVTVTDGVVAFWGMYSCEEERKASHILAENISGVRAIEDHRLILDMNYNLV